MLAEKLEDSIDNLEMLQINTDGLTVKLPKEYENKVYEICKWWENITQLELEYEYYNKMVIRDVNNYLAQTIKGYCKYKGAFEIDKEVAGEPALHKNNSLRIVPIALSKYFINNIPIEQTIRNHDNIYDFCIGIKSKSGWKYKLINQVNNTSKVLQKTNRYYISNDCINDDCGVLKKFHYDGRESYVEAHPLNGKYWKCQLFNDYFEKEISDYNIKYEYYERECRKIINSVKSNQLQLF